MAYFIWAQDMVIDNGPIDDEHKKLVDLVNRLHDATSLGRGHEVIGKLLSELIMDTAAHLRHEEEIMAREGFPSLDNHKIGHQAFVDDLQKLQQRYQQGSISVAAQLSSVLRDWLSLHIRRNDKELHQFMRQQERARRRAATRGKPGGTR